MHEAPDSCRRPYGPAHTATSGQENSLPLAAFLSLPNPSPSFQAARLVLGFVSEGLASSDLILTAQAGKQALSIEAAGTKAGALH